MGNWAKINPKRLGILKEKKNGWNIIVIDHDENYFFDPKTNTFKKQKINLDTFLDKFIILDYLEPNSK